MVTSLLHDIGKLVLVHAYPGYPRQVHGEARTPEERIHRERRELGVDHALVGGVLARRWGLPKSIASVDRAPPRRGRRRRGRARAPGRHARPLRAGRRGLAERAARRARAPSASAPAELRTVMYDLPLPADGGRPRQLDPCPMSSARGRGPAPPRPGHGLQADRPRARRSRPAPCARTCTTSTASSAPWTAPRPSSSPPSAAGSELRGVRGCATSRRASDPVAWPPMISITDEVAVRAAARSSSSAASATPGRCRSPSWRAGARSRCSSSSSCSPRCAAPACCAPSAA